MIAKISHAIDVEVSAIIGVVLLHQAGSGRRSTLRATWSVGRRASVFRRSDAVGTLGLLAGGVGADRRAQQDGAGVDRDLTGGGELELEVVQAARGRATLL